MNSEQCQLSIINTTKITGRTRGFTCGWRRFEENYEQFVKSSPRVRKTPAQYRCARGFHFEVQKFETAYSTRMNVAPELTIQSMER